MKNDEVELADRLRAIDRQLPFDADAFAARVIAEGARRHRRRYASGICVIAALFASGLAWQVHRNTEPQAVVRDDAPDSGMLARDRASTNERTDEVTHSTSVDLNWQQQQLDVLLSRIEKTRATMAAAQTERHRQMLAVHRAKASVDIEVPDIHALYFGTPDDSPD